MEFLQWIEAGPLGEYVRISLWGYPVILASHGVGMALVVGSVVALNMRIMGFAKEISIKALDRVMLIGWTGFIINLVSGLILFAGTATEYVFQGMFQLKIGLIILGGILLKVVMNSVRYGWEDKWNKLFAGACMVSWFGAIITGRWMAYLV